MSRIVCAPAGYTDLIVRAPRRGGIFAACTPDLSRAQVRDVYMAGSSTIRFQQTQFSLLTGDWGEGGWADLLWWPQIANLEVYLDGVRMGFLGKPETYQAEFGSVRLPGYGYYRDGTYYSDFLVAYFDPTWEDTPYFTIYRYYHEATEAPFRPNRITIKHGSHYWADVELTDVSGADWGKTANNDRGSLVSELGGTLSYRALVVNDPANPEADPTTCPATVHFIKWYSYTDNPFPGYWEDVAMFEFLVDRRQSKRWEWEWEYEPWGDTIMRVTNGLGRVQEVPFALSAIGQYRDAYYEVGTSFSDPSVYQETEVRAFAQLSGFTDYLWWGYGFWTGGRLTLQNATRWSVDPPSPIPNLRLPIRVQILRGSFVFMDITISRSGGGWIVTPAEGFGATVNPTWTNSGDGSPMSVGS